MDFAAHIQLLTGILSPGSSKEEPILQAWTSRKEPESEKNYYYDGYKEVETEQPHSVLDIYRQEGTIGHSDSQGLNALDQLNAKPDGHLMLDSVRSILSSGRPDDAISGELAELLGFDNLELVTDILCNRGQFFEEQPLTSLPSKGKGKQPDPKSLAPQQVRRRMEEQLQANASRPLYTGTAHGKPEVLPHVYFPLKHGRRKRAFSVWKQVYATDWDTQRG
ncbi:hypothetical protein BJ322DRAFT_172765 [Thelephora terrestris]|uniref:Uncharacterized protein n=1 Tax=Thelephora terrestris TaxID=56493 RepID=A0A9P6L5A8_9AGAM|nr:hypothetical protein BJ322DRAFT_172765 [Thelephora terrestris]